MFDIGWQELFIVAILALIVVGPKELPRVLRTVMGVVRKARMMARDFQDGLDDVVREADLDDMKKQIGSLADGDLAKTVENALDPHGEIAKDLDMTEVQDSIGKMSTGRSKTDETDVADSGVLPSDSPESNTVASPTSVADDDTKKSG